MARSRIACSLSDDGCVLPQIGEGCEHVRKLKRREGLLTKAGRGALTRRNKKRTIPRVESKARTEGTVGPDKRSAWLRNLDAECPYQITLPRRQLTDDNAIMNFLLSYAGKFDMYVEDECAAYVRYCFADPMDAAIFRSRFEPKSEPFRLAG